MKVTNCYTLCKGGSMEQPEMYKNHFARIIMTDGEIVDQPLLGYALGGIQVQIPFAILGIPFEMMKSFNIYERTQLEFSLNQLC